MSNIVERLLEAVENGPAYQARQRERLAGKVSYGVFEHDASVAGRVNEDGSETFGRFHGMTGEFIPFTPEEDAEFKRRFAWHFTKIFDRNNVVHLPVRKPPSSP